MHLIEGLGRRPTAGMRACYRALDPAAPEDYRQLAALLACDWQSAPPGRVGLGGGQGAGKTTLARLLEAACRQRGLRVALLHLDDFYLTRTDRRALAAHVHPLFETRGPPGTHDLRSLIEAMDALQGEGEVEVPVFDKGLDDRAGNRRLRGPVDLVLVEGWCVGAEPANAAQLATPINALEREEDAEGIWRRAVNEALAGDHRRLAEALDLLVFLRVPGLAAVRRWRLEQERERPSAQRMSPTEIDRFVQHYERVTSAMWASVPERADLVVELDGAHRVCRLSGRLLEGG